MLQYLPMELPEQEKLIRNKFISIRMVGSHDNPGLMHMSLTDLFRKIDNSKNFKEFIVRVSYLEIYNETIKDLLTVDDKSLDLREDPVKGATVAGITEVVATQTYEVITMLKIGNKNRMKEPTGANEVSSRSHAILMVLYFF